MTAFDRRSVWLSVRRNQIIIDLVLIHKVEKMKAFSFIFASYIGKDLLEINFIFSLWPYAGGGHYSYCEDIPVLFLMSRINENKKSHTHTHNYKLIFIMYPKCFYFVFVWCPCMAINGSVQYIGGLLPDIILLTRCYDHRGARLNAMKRFCICSLLWSHVNVLTFSPLTGGCSEGLDAFRFFFKHYYLLLCVAGTSWLTLNIYSIYYILYKRGFCMWHSSPH